MLDRTLTLPEDPEELRSFTARLLAEMQAQAILIEKLRHQLLPCTSPVPHLLRGFSWPDHPDHNCPEKRPDSHGSNRAQFVSAARKDPPNEGDEDAGCCSQNSQCYGQRQPMAEGRKCSAEDIGKARNEIEPQHEGHHGAHFGRFEQGPSTLHLRHNPEGDGCATGDAARFHVRTCVLVISANCTSNRRMPS